MANYQCPECLKISTETEWNNKTQRYFEVPIVLIVEATESTFFCCPKCLQRIYFSNMKRVNADPIASMDIKDTSLVASS